MGHGRTEDKPDRPFDFHQMAEDTVAFMQAIGVGRGDLIGWSDGGNIALDLAINHPERIGRMAITGANFRVDGFAPEVIEWIKQVKPEEFDPAAPRR
ncbi:MAG: alpha/beta fold hydrolase [Deltaproteobacteria bacterium]|nr:MAG: alpha/beta fold hydrolase [Deltaproteobacteria bacterium]